MMPAQQPRKGARVPPPVGDTDEKSARAGDTMAATSWPHATAAASPAASQATSRKAVIASAWNVVSRQKATALAILAAAAAAAAVTTNIRTICTGVIPPKTVASVKTGTAASSSSPVRSRLPDSFPSTSCASPRRLTSRSSMVLRSFSTPTATTLARAADSIASASWSGPRIRISVPPKRAASPTVAMACVPVTRSQQVAMIPRSVPAYTALAT